MRGRGDRDTLNFFTVYITPNPPPLIPPPPPSSKERPKNSNLKHSTPVDTLIVYGVAKVDYFLEQWFPNLLEPGEHWH